MTSEADKFATPRVAAGVLYRDNAGRVLLVKPTYKDGWEIPGGYVERGESPHAAADVASNAGGRCLAAEAYSSIQAARSPQMSHCWYA